MIKLVNGVPEKLVEMDEQVRFIEQMDEDNSGPVIRICPYVLYDAGLMLGLKPT